MTEIALIDYGAGNLRSVYNALRAAGASKVTVTAEPDFIRSADRIVLPGVGSFASSMAGLAAIDGLIAAIELRVREQGAPFLGICVGMQLLAEASEEYGYHAGLGWIGGIVRSFTPTPKIRVPHIGWNDVFVRQSHPVIAPGEAYFLHSYHFADVAEANIVAVGDHGGQFIAAVVRDNMLGVQFHPEKSQGYGIACLERFLAWHP